MKNISKFPFIPKGTTEAVILGNDTITIGKSILYFNKQVLGGNGQISYEYLFENPKGTCSNHLTPEGLNSDTYTTITVTFVVDSHVNRIIKINEEVHKSSTLRVDDVKLSEYMTSPEFELLSSMYSFS